MTKRMSRIICLICNKIRDRLTVDPRTTEQARQEELLLHTAVKRVAIEGQKRELHHG